MSDKSTETQSGFDLQTKLLGGAVIGLGVGLIGLFYGLSSGDKSPFLGWLWGSSFWLSIAIGLLMLIMIFRIFNSHWTPIVRRQQEHGLAAFPWLGLCLLPLLLVGWLGGEQAGILWTWINPMLKQLRLEVLRQFLKMFFIKKTGYRKPYLYH